MLSFKGIKIAVMSLGINKKVTTIIIVFVVKNYSHTVEYKFYSYSKCVNRKVIKKIENVCLGIIFIAMNKS